MGALRLLTVLIFLCGTVSVARAETVLRVGMFPNITHAQALVARHMAREGRGWFAQRLPGVRLEWHVYNAGPPAMEDLTAGMLEFSYVGPNSVLNAFALSQTREVRVLSGAVRGGTALVVQPGSNLSRPEDFKGKRIGTPQLGNTQDIACRAWLKEGGLDVRFTEGNVQVLPTANPDQLGLFKSGQLDGVWTVEPWVARLELEAGGQVMYSEPAALAITTVLAGRASFVDAKPTLAAAFVHAHEDLTRWLVEHPNEAKAAVLAELEHMTGSPFPPEIVERSWSRLNFTTGISQGDFLHALSLSKAAGFPKNITNIDGLVPKKLP